MKSIRRESSGFSHLSFQFTGGIAWDIIRQDLVLATSCKTSLLIFHIYQWIQERGLWEPEGLWGESEEQGERRLAWSLPGVFLPSQAFQVPRNFVKSEVREQRGAGPSREEKVQAQLASLQELVGIQSDFLRTYSSWTRYPLRPRLQKERPVRK